MNNIDAKTVADFGEEWANFDLSKISEETLEKWFETYFSIFPWESLSQKAVGFDLGCGSGRWAKFTALRVNKLVCIDASEKALQVAREVLADKLNVEFINASVDTLPFADNSMDFGYSLGVLHHVPNTGEGIKSCVKKLKPKAPLLLYLYYDFDNRSSWFRLLWKISDIFRRVISKSPFTIKKFMTDVMAIFVYFPAARTASLFEKIGFNIDSFPLSFYRHQNLYFMRMEALDRFGTRLEKRFTKKQINKMMIDADLENIVFSSHAPYWCAVGTKK